MPARGLPARPDLKQLKHQAKDLLRAFRRGDPSAVADFAAYHPQRVDATTARLADAQLVLARSYRAISWPRLAAACELIEAVTHEEFDKLRGLASKHSDVLTEGGDRAGWSEPMAAAANIGLRRVIETLQAYGVRSVSAAMARPAFHKWLDTLRVLARMGGRPPREAVGGSVELLQGDDFAFMVGVGIEIGAPGEPNRDEGERDWRGLCALALETYTRNPAGKHQILDVMADKGVPLPDSPAMAVHRGRLDLLERHLERDADVLNRPLSIDDVYPLALGCHDDRDLALHGAPLDGATLLHMAVEYEELDVARWLIDHGADVNARALVDESGFGGHTPLFSCVVSYNAGRHDERLGRLLLDRGADPNARASIRKRLPFAPDSNVHEYKNVTPLGWGRAFHEQSYVSQAAMRLIVERGGTE
jgi:ankyrin repeat protein